MGFKKKKNKLKHFNTETFENFPPLTSQTSRLNSIITGVRAVDVSLLSISLQLKDKQN